MRPSRFKFKWVVGKLERVLDQVSGFRISFLNIFEKSGYHNTEGRRWKMGDRLACLAEKRGGFLVPRQMGRNTGGE